MYFLPLVIKKEQGYLFVHSQHEQIPVTLFYFASDEMFLVN
jgi:hypothetical protein